MPLNKPNRAIDIVNAAAKGGYAVAAMCCYNVEGILASIRAAEAKKSPVIIQLFPWAITFADGILVHAAREACDTASVPAALHMDHCQDPALVRRAADMKNGFHGIMVDMSHFEHEENMRLTKELVAYCHERGIVTEAEPGRIEGGEDGVADTAELQGMLTTPEQAGEFVDLGIDWLAPAFGNVHGHYGPKGPSLDLDRLRTVRDAVSSKVRLVLHGANGFGEKHFRMTISNGMAKCNINDAMNKEYTRVMKERAGKAGITGLIEEATLAMQKATEEIMDWCGSSGKA